MNLGTPPERYSQNWEAQRNREIESEDQRNLKRQADIELASGAKLILRATDGTRWSVTVSTAGVIGATKLS